MDAQDGNVTTFMELSGKDANGNYRWTPEGFVARLHTDYTIEDRDTGLHRPFGPLLEKKAPQRRFLARVLARIRRGGKIRMVILKSRRQGFSSIIACLIYDLCRFIPGLRAGILSHTGEGTAVIRRMMWGFWKRSKPENRPALEAKNATEMVFGAGTFAELQAGTHDGVDSSITTATARGFNPMTGDGMRVQHYSEMAKYKMSPAAQAALWASAYGTVAPGGPSMVFIESTAKGTEGMFKSKWDAAAANMRDGYIAQEDEFEAFFAGAHDDSSNRRKVEDGYQWADWPDSDIAREERMRRELHVSDEFLRFRRAKIKDYVISADFNDAVRTFREEYPCDPEDAFMATHDGAIPEELLNATVGHVRAPWTFSSTLEDHDAPFGFDAILIR